MSDPSAMQAAAMQAAAMQAAAETAYSSEAEGPAVPAQSSDAEAAAASALSSDAEGSADPAAKSNEVDVVGVDEINYENESVDNTKSGGDSGKLLQPRKLSGEHSQMGGSRQLSHQPSQKSRFSRVKNLFKAPQSQMLNMRITMERLKAKERNMEGDSQFNKSPSATMEEENLAANASLYQRFKHHLKVSMDSDPAAGTTWFDLFIGFVIFLNAIVIGWEANNKAHAAKTGSDDYDQKAFFDTAETVFIIIFCVELALRFWAVGVKNALSSDWVKFDFLLVSWSIFDFYIFPLLVSDSDEIGSSLLTLRLVRLLRLVRAIRLVPMLYPLWLLIQSFLGSALTVMYTLVLFVLILYVSGVLCLQFVAHYRYKFDHNPELKNIIDTHFADLGRCMLSLIQLMTLDDAGAMYTPLIIESPILAFFFLSYILLVAIITMSLVTAVLVQSAMDQASTDRELLAIHKHKAMKLMVPSLRSLFESIDEDDSGLLEKHEMVHGFQENPRLATTFLGLVGCDDPAEIFELLDIDGDGNLSVEEFISRSIRIVKGDKLGVEFDRIKSQLHQILDKLDYANHSAKARELGWTGRANARTRVTTMQSGGTDEASKADPSRGRKRTNRRQSKVHSLVAFPTEEGEVLKGLKALQEQFSKMQDQENNRFQNSPGLSFHYVDEDEPVRSPNASMPDKSKAPHKDSPADSGGGVSINADTGEPIQPTVPSFKSQRSLKPGFQPPYLKEDFERMEMRMRQELDRIDHKMDAGFERLERMMGKIVSSNRNQYGSCWK